MVEQQSALAQAHIMAHQQAQRTSSYFAPPATLAAQASLSGYLPMQTMMQVPPMVAVAKLANSKEGKDTNSTLVVRSSVPRFNVAGGFYTVAQWARKCVEDNLEWIVKLIRRHHFDEQVVMLAYGDGCQTIVLLDDAINQMPDDIETITKIGIGVSSAPKDAKDDETELAKDGVLQPTDSIWDHLRFEQQQSDVSGKDDKGNILFIHTIMTVYGEAVDGRRRVLQVKTLAPKKPLEAVQYVPNPIFEQQLLAKWKGMTSGMTQEQIQRVSMAMMHGMMVPHPAMDLAAAPAQVTAMEGKEGTLITFNPKELILLEKAFDNKLTTRDLKSKADKWSEEDKKNCQLVIKRANDEFKWVIVRKRKKPAASAAGDDATVAKKKATKVPEGGDDKKPEAKKSTTAKEKSTLAKDKKESTIEKAAPKTSHARKTMKKEIAPPTLDSDDEPISKLKEKKDAEKKKGSTATPVSRRKSKGNTATATNRSVRGTAVKKETNEKKETTLIAQSPKKRGRPAKKDENLAKKTTRRSTSKSTKSRM
jgi:hypothetical protein